MYIELSGRGSGKTYRAGVDIVNWISGSTHNIAVLKAPSKRQAMMMSEYAKDVSPRIASKRILWWNDFKRNEGKYKDVNKKFYFDEFDMTPLSSEHLFDNGYYATTPLRFRKIKDFKSGDFLYDLLKYNNFIYCNRSLTSSELLHKNYFYEEMERIGEKEVLREYFAQFLEK